VCHLARPKRMELLPCGGLRDRPRPSRLGFRRVPEGAGGTGPRSPTRRGDAQSMSRSGREFMTRLKPGLSLFLPFAAAYFISYLFRVINAVIAGTLVAEFDLDAAQL